MNMWRCDHYRQKRWGTFLKAFEGQSGCIKTELGHSWTWHSPQSFFMLCCQSAFFFGLGVGLPRQASVHPSLTGCTVSMQGSQTFDMVMFVKRGFLTRAMPIPLWQEPLYYTESRMNKYILVDLGPSNGTVNAWLRFLGEKNRCKDSPATSCKSVFLTVLLEPSPLKVPQR